MQILHEDKNIVVINKPSGLNVHPDGKIEEDTVTDWVIENYPEAKGVGEPMVISGPNPSDGQEGKTIDRPGIVHRLDKETSGVLIIAKNQKAYEHLKSQFKNREVKKIYHTFVYGNIKEGSGIIEEPIGRSKGNIRLWTTEKFARGKIREAVTLFKVLKRGIVKSEDKKDENYCLLEVELKTGRTHQIRVHMKYLQHSVVCDKLYSPKRPCLFDFKRLALHARNISFNNLEGEKVVVEAPYPEDFQKAFDLT